MYTKVPYLSVALGIMLLACCPCSSLCSLPSEIAAGPNEQIIGKWQQSSPPVSIEFLRDGTIIFWEATGDAGAVGTYQLDYPNLTIRFGSATPTVQQIRLSSFRLILFPPGVSDSGALSPTEGAEFQRVETTPEERLAKPVVTRLSQQDLAQKLGVSLNDIRVVSVEETTWSDGSLGCPQPGKVYAQVITPGFRVVFEANGQRYEYHTDKERHIVLCTK
jgi:hypothetical protein